MRNTLLLLIILFTISCVGKQSAIPEVSDDEYAVINVALQRTVMPVERARGQVIFRYRELPKFPPPGTKWTAKDREHQKFQLDSAQAVLDTAKFYVAIQQDLEYPPGQEIAYLRSAKQKDLIANGYHSTVKVKQIAYTVDSNKLPVKLLKECITPKKGYHFTFYNKNGPPPALRLGPGKFILSRVAFNPSKTMAFIYIKNYCGGECGGGMLYFLEKINGKWQIFEEHLTWVA